MSTDEVSLYRRTVIKLSAAGQLLAERVASSGNGLVALLDLDGFGRINSRHGVDTGDVLLARIERSLQHAVAGQGDALAMGGDQFLVVLPGPRGAEVIAPALLAAVRRTGARTSYGRPIRVTASAGLARWPEHARTGGDLLAAADRALRQAKAAIGGDGWAEHERMPQVRPAAPRRALARLGALRGRA